MIDVGAKARKQFTTEYGFDPFERLAGGGTVWIRREPRRPLIYAILMGAVVAAAIAFVAGLLLGQVRRQLYLLELLVAVGALFGLLAGFMWARSRWNSGIAISRTGLIFRDGQRSADIACESVTTIMGEDRLAPTEGGRIFAWKHTIITAENDRLKLADFKPHEHEVAYHLLLSVCPYAVGLRPDGIVDVGVSLAEADRAQWMGEAAAILKPELQRRRRVWWIITGVTSAASLGCLALAYLATSQSRDRDTGELSRLAIPLLVATVAAIVRAVQLTARLKALFAGFDLAIDRATVEPDFAPPTVSPAARTAVAALSIAALVLAVVPIIGSILSLIALDRSRGIPGPWRKLSIVAVVLSSAVIVGALAWIILANMTHHR